MSCRIVIDSGGEYTDEMKQDERYHLAQLSVEIDGRVYVDETITQQELLKHIAESPNCPKSSCPSPETFMELCRCDEERVYIVTISSQLSGSYNSAILGKNLYEEECGKKNIYIFDSKSASVGQTNICTKISECEALGMSFEEVIEEVEKFISDHTIYFVLESLETLRKNGRLTGIKSVLAGALNIKPVMSADKNGVITQLAQARGVKKALVKMVDTMIKDMVSPEDKVIGIAHCNNKERAEQVKNLIEERIKVKEIYITETSGISTLYASDGGIIMAL